MPAKKISLDKAKKNKLFYFVANIVIFRQADQRCLILKRDMREIVHPGKYCVPGGKLEWANLDINHPTRINGEALDFEDAVEKLLKREAKEEAGIEISDEMHYLNSVAFIRPDETPVVSLKFAGKYKSGKIKLEKGSFTDFVWVSQEEVKKYNCIKGIKEEIAETIKLFS
jgi:8-oxo-dGTP pyrophosphatase MutT (NUDIX family)